MYEIAVEFFYVDCLYNMLNPDQPALPAPGLKQFCMPKSRNSPMIPSMLCSCAIASLCYKGLS
jgi:hypothetical protein